MGFLVYHFRYRSSVHSHFCEILLEECRHAGKAQYYLPSSDRWADRAHHSDIGRHVEGVYDRLQRQWDNHLLLIEFSYNNSYHSSIGMALFEALYGRRCSSLVGWFEVGESSILDPEIIYEALEKVRVIRGRLATAYNRQKSYADNRQWPLEFDVGDQVYLEISPI